MSPVLAGIVVLLLAVLLGLLLWWALRRRARPTEPTLALEGDAYDGELDLYARHLVLPQLRRPAVVRTLTFGMQLQADRLAELYAPPPGTLDDEAWMHFCRLTVACSIDGRQLVHPNELLDLPNGDTWFLIAAAKEVAQKGATFRGDEEAAPPVDGPGGEGDQLEPSADPGAA